MNFKILDLVIIFIAFLLGKFGSGLVRNYLMHKKGNPVEKNIYGKILNKLVKAEIGEKKRVYKEAGDVKVTISEDPFFWGIETIYMIEFIKRITP